jgi:diguanylate cyclase (GGDEF)-like protein
MGRWFAGPNGRPAFAHGTIRVITERFEAERDVEGRCQLDSLTGALDRCHLIEHAGRLLRNGVRRQGSFAILLATIEKLVVVNNAHGYDVGDELLLLASKRLRSRMRSTDLLARYSGNKFALLLESCDAEQMRVAARRFLAAMEEVPLATSAGRIQVSLRIGGVVAPRDHRSPQVLLQLAEQALEQARLHEADHFVAYKSGLARGDTKARILEISDGIVVSLNQSRQRLALQPVVATKTNQTRFYEGVIRLHNPDGAPIPSAALFSIAGETGLRELIDHRLLDMAIAELAARPKLELMIEPSGETVFTSMWQDRLCAICSVDPKAAQRLYVQINEADAIRNAEATQHVFAMLKICGAKIAIKNFGSGHISQRNLSVLNVDLLKIDGALLQNIARSSDNRFFVRSLVEIARDAVVPIAAEWVDEPETARILADWGVDYLQGSLYGKAEVRSRGPKAFSPAA